MASEAGLTSCFAFPVWSQQGPDYSWRVRALSVALLSGTKGGPWLHPTTGCLSKAHFATIPSKTYSSVQSPLYDKPLLVCQRFAMMRLPRPATSCSSCMLTRDVTPDPGMAVTP